MWKANRIATRLGSWAFVRAQSWCERQTAEKAARAGERIGRLAFRLSRKHRERTLSNLELAFPEWDAAGRQATAIKVFEHFGRTAADFLRTPVRTGQHVLETTTVSGLEHLTAASSLGKGVLAVTCHLGNWERGAQWFAASGYPTSVIARDSNDSELTDMMTRLRNKAGAEVIPRGNAARPVLSKLRNNEMVAILPDQNSSEVFVPFFGKLAGTVQGPAVLHFRTGAPLVPLACVSTGFDSLHIEFLEPIIVGKDEGVSSEDLTARVNLAIESLIRMWPDQYLWLHDRWKSARRKGYL